MNQIDEILKIEDETDMVLEIGEILWNKYDETEDFSQFNIVEKNIIFVEILEGEVNNGGFDQFFFNTSGDFSHETLDALNAVKAYKMAKILEKAIKFFPSLPIPKETITRREVMKSISEEIQDEWDKLDEEYYEYPDNLTNLVAEYIRKNKNFVGG